MKPNNALNTNAQQRVRSREMSSQPMHLLRFLLMSLVFVLASLMTGCGPSEPDKEVLQRAFVQHTKGYEEILSMFRKDIAESNLSFVSAESPGRTQCGYQPQRHECILRSGRWVDYQRRMNHLGVLWVEHEKQPDRFYFVTYYESFLMDARLLGVVFSEDRSPLFSSSDPKQKWWPLEGGWYAFLKIDS